MKFTAEIIVMPLEEILDPQGNAVLLGLKNLGLEGALGVRAGRHIRLVLNAESETQAAQLVEKACKQLLANLIMESYTYTITATTA